MTPPISDPPKKRRSKKTKLTSRFQVSEFKIQMDFCKFMNSEHPTVWYHADRGGQKSTKKAGALQKLIGSKHGVPDMQIYKPSGKYHGLFIEFKKFGEVPRVDQKQWLKYLNSQGYKAVYVDNLQDAKRITNKYLLSNNTTVIPIKKQQTILIID